MVSNVNKMKIAYMIVLHVTFLIPLACVIPSTKLARTKDSMVVLKDELITSIVTDKQMKCLQMPSLKMPHMQLLPCILKDAAILCMKTYSLVDQ